MSRVKNYSDFLTRFASTIGYEVGDLETAELTIINSFFNKAMKQIWQAGYWTDVCVYGEYRVPNNQLAYGKSFANSHWTKTNVAITSAVAVNPVDVNTNGDLVLETSATAAHSVSQTATVYSTTTSVSVFVQPAGRGWIQISFTDSASATFSAFFNVATGALGTIAGGSTVTATINQTSGLWYQCTLNFTPTAYGTGTATISLSPDGSTLSYAGNTGLGVNLWGASLVPTSPSGVTTQLIPWEQTGENAIDIVFPGGVYNMTPIATSYPSRVGWKPTNNGIQIINSTNGWNAMYYVQSPQAATTTTSSSPLSPVYIDYRTRVPDYTGAAYSTATTYTFGSQFYYTAANGNSNYYTTIVPSVTNQTPDASPTSFTALTIPYAFYDYAVESCYADWLRTEQQIGKAQIQDGRAQDIMDREFDRQERQMGRIQPWRIQTHLTSRPNTSR